MVVLLVFGSTRYQKALQHLVQEAFESYWFEAVDIWNERRLQMEEPEWFQEHQHLVTRYSKYGYGLWCWKPFLVSRCMRAFPNHTIVYLDAGCQLNVSKPSAERFQEYVLAAQTHGLCVFQLQALDRQYCRCDVLQRITRCDSPEQVQSRQIMSGAFVLSASHPKAIQAVEEWQYWSDFDKGSLLDPDATHHHRGFRSHRHDQSIFSLVVRALADVYIVDDETYFAPDWATRGASYPFWARRRYRAARH